MIKKISLIISVAGALISSPTVGIALDKKTKQGCAKQHNAKLAAESLARKANLPNAAFPSTQRFTPGLPGKIAQDTA